MVGARDVAPGHGQASVTTDGIHDTARQVESGEPIGAQALDVMAAGPRHALEIVRRVTVEVGDAVARPAIPAQVRLECRPPLYHAAEPPLLIVDQGAVD